MLPGAQSWLTHLFYYLEQFYEEASLSVQVPENLFLAL